MLQEILKCRKYTHLTTLWFIFLLFNIETKKPTNKRLLSIWLLECELGIISDPDCPIHGGWTPWSPWSPCQGHCDDVGSRHRYRLCNNPSPSADGTPCSGNNEQTEVCFITNCTTDEFRRVIIGDTVRMTAFHYLEAVPGLIERCLQIDCPYEAIEAALTVENTWQLDAESLWNALQCVRRNLGCPITGEWGTWGTWSACGARCGQGFKWRLRRCDTPPPSAANLVCSGVPFQADMCVGDQCAISSHDSKGSWGEWSPWSKCTEKCGPGVRRRRRICHETTTPSASGTWGTHCRGQHDQLDICENPKCDLDGGWSGWSAWGPCSKACGAGKRSRTRSCTRPVPAGKGASCVGSRVEVGPCHLTPCEGFSHNVAIFHGESYLRYDLSNKRAALFHCYIRFMPTSPHGTLIRRTAGSDSFVRVSLQKWHVCLDACGSSQSCCLPRLCSYTTIDPAVWHTVLVSLTYEGAMLRLDDALDTLKRTWPCVPELVDNKLSVYIGNRFQGQIQELILNFIPLKMLGKRDTRSVYSYFYPLEVSNVAYETSDTSESYLHIKNDHYLRLPCYENQNEWMLELTFKPTRESGTILFFKDDKNYNWLHVELQNMRLKLKLALGEFRSDCSSTFECTPDKWQDLILTKRQETNAIEASISAGERLHVLFQDDQGYLDNQLNRTKNFKIYELCSDEFFIGGVPIDVQHQISQEEFIPFSGVLASVRLNKALLDLHDYSLERYKENKIQVSSKTASVSGSYHETAWGKSNRLNLTCIHAKTATEPHTASWLYLDTTVIDVQKDKVLKSIDNGKILRLVASGDKDLIGFYTCRGHRHRYTRNIVTYGVLGQRQYNFQSPDLVTGIACVTTLSLVIATLIWLIIEGIQDIRNGYGFFRDAHLTPEEEAEEVCAYIERNLDLIGSVSAAQVAKLKARRRVRHLNRINFAAQEPQGMLEENFKLRDNSLSDLTDPHRLPTLPEIQTSLSESNKEDYNFEPCYLSSPRHGSCSPPGTIIDSNSSFEIVSPRVLCSKLLVPKDWQCSNENLYTRKKNKARYSPPRKVRPKFLTIQSCVARNQAQRILQRFHALKSDDSKASD